MNQTKTVQVCASSSYDVIIGSGLLHNCAKLIKNVKKPCRALIITDSNVDKLYSDIVIKSFQNEGYTCDKYVFKAGEQSKNADTFIDILEYLASTKLTRSDLVIALGGGVVGDIAGFCASCYLRGIDFIQIPTTLLSAVDSSVGGKTAIDLKAGKNLAGAFYQPLMVVCDTDTFNTLPSEQLSCGYAEVIKYGVLYEKEFCDYLSYGNCDMSYIVERCVKFKADVVQRDEHDRGERKYLNLGHTMGHGIEKHSGFTLCHGQAVAVGMVLAMKIAENMQLCKNNTHKELEVLLTKYGLPTRYSIDAKTLCDAALSDKKREGGKISLVLPNKIGKCSLLDVDVTQLEEIFEKALNN